MQNDPEKTLGNYNEFLSARPAGSIPGQPPEGHEAGEQQWIIDTGIRLVNNKVDEILGKHNQLTTGDLDLPKTTFIDTLPEHPNWSGYFSAFRNEIVVVTDKTKNRAARVKVFVHEYLHFLSHNGRDDREQVDANSPLSEGNNVGFRRNRGLDIRKGNEGQITHDYFLSFNEAVTEQLAIDIMPGIHETYGDYRGLLNQVIDDVTTQGLGTQNSDGTILPWPRQQVKDYIYSCFFRGDLSGFTQLLQTTYQKYDISEQQFGLMTHKDDLPSMIEEKWREVYPDDPPLAPTIVSAMVQARLDNKTPDDYITDVIGPEPGDDDDENMQLLKYGTAYDTYVRDAEIVPTNSKVESTEEYNLDSIGYIIYHGEAAASMFRNIKAILDDMLIKAGNGEIDPATIAEHMDHLLFETYTTSMLSEGFRDFYIYKHAKLENL